MKKLVSGILLVTVIVSGIFFTSRHVAGASGSEFLSWLSEGDPAIRLRKSKLFYRDQPYTGLVIRNAENGLMLSLTWYRNGDKQGPRFQWSNDGSLASIRFYREGRPEALNWGFWPNGKLKFLYLFQEGGLEGLSQDWYEDGKPYLKRNYSQGHELGLQQAWNQEGKIISNYVMKGEKRYGLVGSQPCFTVH